MRPVHYILVVFFLVVALLVNIAVTKPVHAYQSVHVYTLKCTDFEGNTCLQYKVYRETAE